MAPKPVKKPTAVGGKKSSDGKPVATPIAGAPASDDGVALAPPKNKEEVLNQLSFDGLPNPPVDQIVDIVSKNYERLVKIFAHYCKFQDCKTIESATRCKLGEHHCLKL